jgi:hypothetical protein
VGGIFRLESVRPVPVYYKVVALCSDISLFVMLLKNKTYKFTHLPFTALLPVQSLVNGSIVSDWEALSGDTS